MLYFQEYIAIFADVHFPTVFLCPNRVEFLDVASGCKGGATIAIANHSPLQVQYEWKWRRESLKVEDTEVMDIMF